MISNIEEKVLRELRSTHTLSELNQEQRHELRIFCEAWEDTIINLVSISDSSHAKGEIVQMAQKKHEKFKHPCISALGIVLLDCIQKSGRIEFFKRGKIK